jgi:hypothetical protein
MLDGNGPSTLEYPNRVDHIQCRRNRDEQESRSPAYQATYPARNAPPTAESRPVNQIQPDREQRAGANPGTNAQVGVLNEPEANGKSIQTRPEAQE